MPGAGRTGQPTDVRRRAPSFIVIAPIEGGIQVSILGWLAAKPDTFPDRVTAIRYAAMLAKATGSHQLCMPRRP